MKCVCLLTKLAVSVYKRRDYPEVSYGVVHGFIEGLMGVSVDFDNNQISLKPNLTKATEWAQLENLMVLSTLVSIKHEGTNSIAIENKGKVNIKVKFCFDDKYNQIIVDGNEVPTTNDLNDRILYCIVDCESGAKLHAVAN
ncbi:MAG: hypothetical protein HC831_05665 [Chloroflexia bacterium]|nr:hypothetical protein [Chloroflexia bacterium]